MKYLLPFAPVVLLVAAGCGGDKRAEVSGTVTVAGKGPLPGGTITFSSTADATRLSSGVIKADGTYRVPDAPVGECTVSVDNSQFDPNTRKSGMGMGGTPAGMGAPGMKGSPGGAGPKGPSSETKAKMGAAPGAAGVGGEMGAAESANTKFVKIETTYASPTSSPLRATIGTGSNSFNFDVK